MRRAACARLLLGLMVVTAIAACNRDTGRADRATQGAARSVAFDADSAARGLLAPELASLLAVEPLLARASEPAPAVHCKQDTLRDIRHVRLRVDVRSGDTSTTMFARRTPKGELRRSEVLRRLPDGTAFGASWDADEKATTVSEFGGGTVKKTTSHDDDAPLAHALQYVGRRVLATRCGAR